MRFFLEALILMLCTSTASLSCSKGSGIDDRYSDTRDSTKSNDKKNEKQNKTAKSWYVNNAAEITSALDHVSPGDTIVMINGEWISQDIRFEADGKKDSLIILRSQTPGKVILKGRSAIHIGGSYLKVDGLVFKDGYPSSGRPVIEFRSGGREAASCRLTNTVIHDYNDTITANPKGNAWISLFGNNNRVDHCYFDGKTSGGATLIVWRHDNKANYHTIDSNYFGERPRLGKNGGETIRIGTSTFSQSNSNTIVRGNYFYRCNGEGEIISSKSGGNVFEQNTFYECQGALTLRHGNNCVVKNNLFIGNNKKLTGGVRVIGSGHIILNNYFRDLGGTGARGAISLVKGQINAELFGYWPIDSVTVKNNILIHCKQNIEIIAHQQDQVVKPRNVDMESNLIFTSDSTVPPGLDIPPGISRRPVGPRWE